MYISQSICAVVIFGNSSKRQNRPGLGIKSMEMKTQYESTVCHVHTCHTFTCTIAFVSVTLMQFFLLFSVRFVICARSRSHHATRYSHRAYCHHTTPSSQSVSQCLINIEYWNNIWLYRLCFICDSICEMFVCMWTVCHLIHAQFM